MKGRHSHVSVILSSQKGSLLNPVSRVNSDSIYVFKLRNFQDLQMIIDEYSALVNDKKEMMEIYKRAVEDQPYSFLYINMQRKPRFYIRYEKEIILE